MAGVGEDGQMSCEEGSMAEAEGAGWGLRAERPGVAYTHIVNGSGGGARGGTDEEGRRGAQGSRHWS